MGEKDEKWEEDGDWTSDPWSYPSADPGSGASQDGWMSDAQLRDFNVARVDQMTAINNGRWAGSYDFQADWPERAWRPEAKPTEKLVVPEFVGEGINDAELGRSARSYVRRVQVWLRCAKMSPEQRALALYTAIHRLDWQGLGLCRRAGCGSFGHGDRSFLLPRMDPNSVHGGRADQDLADHE